MQARVCTGRDIASALDAVDDRLTSGFDPTVGVVFCSVSHDFAELGRLLAARGITVVGVTTAGEIADDRILEEACVVMLMDPDPEAFAVRLMSVDAENTIADLAKELGRYATATFASPVVLAFASGVRSDGEPVVGGVHAGAGRTIPLFGGMAGDDLRMTDSYVFSGSSAYAEGLIGFVLDGDRFHVEGTATSGWQPVGVEKTITSSQANVVSTIDGEPALDVYRQYLNIEDLGGYKGGQAVALGVQYPLMVNRGNGTSVIRAPLFFGAETGSLIFAGGVPQGATVTFCIPPSLDIVERVVAEAADVHRSIPDADAILLVSCKARHLALGPLAEDEVRELHGMWQAPMAGFFSYGEIGGRNPQDCDFHTETCTLVVIRERPAAA
jgi:hypothetical protein